MKRILVFSNTAALPDQNASALRITSIVDALIESGYECIVVGQSKCNERTLTIIKEGYYLYSIYNYQISNSIKNKINTFLKPDKKILSAYSFLKEKFGKFDSLMIYQQLPNHITKRIVKLCKEENIKLYFDIVEYQTISQQNLFTFFQFYLPNSKTVKKWTKYGKIISISSYLNKYFINKGRQSIFVPFFFNMNQMMFYSKQSLYDEDGKITFIYAGCPSRGRDTIVNAIKGVLLLNENERNKIRFVVAGASQEVFIKNGLSKKEYNSSLSFCEYIGKVPHEKVEEIYKTANFSIYLKPAKKRFSKAGFPTKVSESLSFGTPIIANLSSDIGLYLNKTNSVIIKDDSPESFVAGIREILKPEFKNSYSMMSKSSRETAEKELSLEKYKDILSSYFK